MFDLGSGRFGAVTALSHFCCVAIASTQVTNFSLIPNHKKRLVLVASTIQWMHGRTTHGYKTFQLGVIHASHYIGLLQAVKKYHCKFDVRVNLVFANIRQAKTMECIGEKIDNEQNVL